METLVGSNGVSSGSEDEGSDEGPASDYASASNASDTEDEAGLSDEGDLSDDNVGTTFAVPYHLGTETCVSRDRVYVLHLCGAGDKIAAALTDNSCSVYDVGTLSRVAGVKGHTGTISDVRFGPGDQNLLYSASLDGRVKLWDLRMENNCVKEFKDDTDGDGRTKPLTCFDASCDGRHLCAGTELIGADSFLLFWDARSGSLLGGYWECHTDDVTRVAFHPERRNSLASGSTDGLVNVFDVGAGCEEDALQGSLNTESSVSKLDWFSRRGDGDCLACITHTEHLQLWQADGAAPYFSVSRPQLTRSLRRNPSDNAYLANFHRLRDSADLLVVAGSSGGDGQCLRTLRITDTTIAPMSDLIGNRQIVRASWFDETNEVLVTAGESGFLSVWRPGKSPNVQVVHSEMKVVSSVKHSLALHTSKPY